MKKAVGGLVVMFVAVFIVALPVWAGTPKPDLVFEQIQVNLEGDEPGLEAKASSSRDQVTVTWQISNKGEADAGGFWVNILQASQWRFDLTSRRRARYWVEALPSGEILIVKQTITAGMKEGASYLGLQVDVINQVKESNESNNHSSPWKQNQIAIVTNGNVRSTDFCYHMDDPAWAIVTWKLKNGWARHALKPEELIVLGSLENPIKDKQGNERPQNPLWVIMTLDNEKGLISHGSEFFADLEESIAQCMGYGVKRVDYARWIGFIDQITAGTWQQKHYYEEHGYTMEEAFTAYTGGEGNWATAQAIYAQAAQFMNRRLRTKFPLYPNSEGYYFDFGVVAKKRTKEFIAAVRAYLNYKGSVLKPSIFSQVASPSAFIPDYRDTVALCTVAEVLPSSRKKAGFEPEHDAFDFPRR